eukprot:SAG11_NODE_73_length_18072_cov_8.670005_3_plen_96_part_00
MGTILRHVTDVARTHPPPCRSRCSAEPTRHRRTGYILEGFPRTPAQAKALAESATPPHVVLALDMDDAAARARDSDGGEALEAQLADWRQVLQPV